MINGEKDLNKLLKSMNPILDSREFVFCTLQKNELEKINFSPICQFQEKEGITFILEKSEAERNNLKFIYPCKMITLAVHSNLNAVGFLAVVTAKLSDNQISVNVISAFYHDHLFVPVEKAEQAVQILLNSFSGVK